MELYLIRHGQSVNNALPVEERVEDPALTDIGHRQAAHSAEWAKSAGLTRLIVSPFRRTLETAEYIRQATGLIPEVWIDLHEQGGCMNGIDEASYIGRPGMTAAEIQAAFPHFALPPEIDHRGWWQSRPHETLAETALRAQRLWQRTHQSFARTDERIAFVMHGHFKLILIETLIAMIPDGATCGDDVFNAGITKFAVTPEKTKLVFFNFVDHLPRAVITPPVLVEQEADAPGH